MKQYLKFKLFLSFVNPLFYVSALIFNITCPVYYLYFKNFFSGNGTTDLYNFFCCATVVLSIIIPITCLNYEKNVLEEIFPFSVLQTKIISVLTAFIQLFLIIIPQVLVIPCLNNFGSVDSGAAFCSFLMLFFFVLCAISICVFLEEVFTKRNVSIILSILILLLLNFLNYLCIYFNEIPLLLFITKAVSLSWHFDASLKGILDTRDLLFFVAASCILIYSSCLINQKRKTKIYSKENKVIIISIFVFFVFFMLNSGRYYLRKDISSNHKITVSKYTKNVLSEIDGKIAVTYYKSHLLDSLYPQARDISDYLKELAYNRNIIYSEKNPDNSEYSDLLKDYGIYGKQFQTVGKNKTEYTTVYSTIVIEYNENWDIIPFILSANSLEYDLDVRFLNLIYGKKQIVNILCGNGLNLQESYGYVIPWLNSQGMICNEIKLDDNIFEQLKYSKTLLLLGSEKITEEHCQQIDDFISSGGSVFAAVSEFNIDIENSWYITKTENLCLFNLLKKYGFNFNQNLIADYSCARITMQSNQDENGKDSVISQNLNYPLWISVLPQKNTVQGFTVFWPEKIESINENVQPYIFSSYNSWLIEPDYSSSETLFLTNPFGFNELIWNQKKNENAIVYKNVEKKIIVIPDQFFVHSLMLGYAGGQTGDYRNLDFLANTLIDLAGNEELAEIHKKSFLSNNSSLFKIYDEESFNKAKITMLFCMFIFVPVLIISFWIIFIIRRKQQVYKYE